MGGIEMSHREKGQSTVEFLVIGTIVMGMVIVGIQVGALLVKTEQVGFAAFWASRSSCVHGDAVKAGHSGFGREPWAENIAIWASNGTSSIDYGVKPGTFPLANQWLGGMPSSIVHLPATCVLFPDPGGDEGDN